MFIILSPILFNVSWNWICIEWLTYLSGVEMSDKRKLWHSYCFWYSRLVLLLKNNSFSCISCSLSLIIRFRDYILLVIWECYKGRIWNVIWRGLKIIFEELQSTCAFLPLYITIRTYCEWLHLNYSSRYYEFINIPVYLIILRYQHNRKL